MAGRNSTENCSNGALEQLASHITCPDVLLAKFDAKMGWWLWQKNILLMASVVLSGVIVWIDVYGQRYRYQPFTRFIFFGATTLFLPIISWVASADDIYIMNFNQEITFLAECKHGFRYSPTVVIWAFLVHIIMLNTSLVVSVDDREGQNIGPRLQLLVHGVWTFYLGINYLITNIIRGSKDVLFIANVTLPQVTLFGLICAKMVFKYYAFKKAQKSLALGRNPRLIFGYMQQPPLEEASQHCEPTDTTENAPPPLLVMGEEARYVEKQPHGYVLKDDSGKTFHNNIGLVTLDRAWQQLDSVLPSVSRPQQLKDLCLSFALFKLLRCRFARYKFAVNDDSKNISNFFWGLLLKNGEQDRLYRVIVDELSFVHDYYYTSLPISYSKRWLPILGTVISLSSMGYCIWFVLRHIQDSIKMWMYGEVYYQTVCGITCIEERLLGYWLEISYGSSYFEDGPLFLLYIVVMVAEVRDIASFLCSNWTKVGLIYHLLNSASSKWHSVCMQARVARLLRCKCKLVKYWDDEMGQCSVLVLHPRTTLPTLVRCSHCLPHPKRKVKVPAAVKVCIINALRTSRTERLSNGISSLRRWSQSQVGEEGFFWACNSKSASGTMLTWHIATSILEVRYPYQHNQENSSQSTSDHKIAATYLSRYSAYLMTLCPELLPDDDAWSKGLYKAVNEDAKRVLSAYAATAAAPSTPEAKYQQLMELLGANSKHEVLKDGVKLGRQLVEAIDGEETAWDLLANFWSEMILYVAPSDNLKGHSEAIARGGELITLLWALLFHAGIIVRGHGDDDGVAAPSTGVV
ncbi:unnamed protein product [Urochloa decumbens]|uniref:DUF4220 domain-containing protein n=1 Tax=Urochloa decumbens TaxID=240449 RepID=A0ABC9BX25_9POAL